MSTKLKTSDLEKIILLAKELASPTHKHIPNDFTERITPIIQQPKSKHFLIKLMDVAFRSNENKKIARYVKRLFKQNEHYESLFTTYEKVMVRLFQIIGHNFPGISIPVMLTQIQEVSNTVLFFTGEDAFKNHVSIRKKEKISLNINLIGESLLGENEAKERIQQYIELLQQKDINYISIKISTIYSQISSLAHEESVNKLSKKLSTLYDELLLIEKKSGEKKFINLDMEEYRDLSLTVDTFIKTLSLPKYKNLRVGIVLQAYIPDSFSQLIRLQNWAKERLNSGGSPIKIRIVKGANLEMEKTESSIEKHELVTFKTKKETDANYKKMILQALTTENCNSVHIGIASHNIFDIAFALHLVKTKNIEDKIDFEMLEGMANPLVKTLKTMDVNVLLYLPIVKKDNYINAIAYLVRRLDEGTADGNFLKEGINLKVGDDNWENLEGAFIESYNIIDKIPETPFRKQNRNTEKQLLQNFGFQNTPNTDWVLPENQTWANAIIKKWSSFNPLEKKTIKVSPTSHFKNKEQLTLQTWEGESPWSYELANEDDYINFLDIKSEWTTLKKEDRISTVRKVAVALAKNRSELIGVAAKELGKLIEELDVEVSEAIDFANYYAHSFETIIEENPSLSFHTGGTNLVLSPWNFPIAIPCGGILASLIAGKRVILKPSTNASATANLLCECLWEAGIPKSALGFLPAKEETLDPFLSEGNIFEAVILTGGTDTAKFLLNRNPHLNLFAETGGKNSTIVTGLSDREQAIKNVLQSAFGNNGQKCSATSLLILEEEVFNDPHFKALLKDALVSKTIGNPWNLKATIGPLATPINERLKNSIKNTPKDLWLVEPKIINNFLVTPGIKWGLTENDFEFNTELFGPILSVIKARDLNEAIRIANLVPYGLTSGIESLDENEIKYWKENIQAGNLYINRQTTGAIVQRQPFGGIKNSSFGFGMKAGGENYLWQFLEIKNIFSDHRNDYKLQYKNRFSKQKDYSKCRGQHNINRYLKPDTIFILVDELTPNQDIRTVIAACEAIESNFEVVAFKAFSSLFNIKTVNNYNSFINKITYKNKVRCLCYDRLTIDTIKAFHNKGIHLYKKQPTVNGRFELLNYLTEQNISHNYHRYGNLMGVKSLY